MPPPPHARYRLVAGTLTRSARHPVGGAGHFELLDHHRVHDALPSWLGQHP